MDALALIEQARTAGLTLSVVDGALRVKGPRRMSALVELIADNKEGVIAALCPIAPVPAPAAGPPPALSSRPSADADTRGEIPDDNNRVSTCSGNIEADASAADASIWSVPGRVEGQTHCPNVCGALHVQPQHWIHRDCKAFCPGCDKFMGHVRSGE